MNVADSIYYNLYKIVDTAVYGGFITAMGNLKPLFYSITIIAVVFIGYKLLYPSNENTFLNSLKSLVAVLVVHVILTYPVPLYSAIKMIIIDMPISFAEFTVGGMLESLGYESSPINMKPSGEGHTIFGSIWDFINKLSKRLLVEAGWDNIGMYIIAYGLLLIGVILIAVMIMLMGTALIMAAAVILGAPAFIWMIMFKQGRPMFDGWLKIGMTASVAMFLILNMTGILLAFMNQFIVEAFQVSLFVPDSLDLLKEEGTVLSLENISMSMLFMIIIIKMLPQTQVWATTIGGAIGTNISSGALDLGKAISQKLTQGAGKLGMTAAEPMKESAANLGNNIKEGASNVRDRMMQDRIASDMRQVNDSNNSDLSETQAPQQENQQSEPAQIPEKDVYFNQAPQQENQQSEREPVEAGTANNESQNQQNVEVTNINNQDERQEVRNDVDVKQEAPQEPESTESKGENEAPEAIEKEPVRQEAKEVESSTAQQSEAPQSRHDETVKSVEKEGHIQTESREQEQGQIDSPQGNIPGQFSDGNKPGENETQDNAPAESDKEQKNATKRNESKEFKQDD